ncbi:MAG: ABC transporter ATP-binding protein [bacterium]
MNPVLELQKIHKEFPGIVANDQIDLTLNRGEIHTILGENGAGKSTLMNIISGLYIPDSGSMFLEGKPLHLKNPAQAIAKGVGMVHQHFMLIPNHSVSENIILGTPQAFRLQKSKVRQQIEELGRRYGLELNPDLRVQDLSVGEQQKVEILKVLFRGAKILILDEPTAVLTPQESEALYKILHQMKKDGHSILFISHKMREVIELSDRITVLRHGKVKATRNRGETSPSELARLMMGESTIQTGEIQTKTSKVSSDQSQNKTIVRLKNAGLRHELGHWLLQNINLEVRAGQIVGLAGVAGSGQAPLAEVLVGLRGLDTGKYQFAGEEQKGTSVSELIHKGVGYIPEDRKRYGIAPHLEVAENFLLRDLHNNRFQSRGWLQRDKVTAFGRERMRAFDVRAASEKTPIGQLSGGNMQKVILARETSRPLKFLLAAQPVRGLDIHATAFLQNQLLQARADGLAILLISEDLEELLLMSDYLYVICRGSIVGEMPKEEAEIEKIGLLMTGERA